MCNRCPIRSRTSSMVILAPGAVDDSAFKNCTSNAVNWRNAASSGGDPRSLPAELTCRPLALAAAQPEINFLQKIDGRKYCVDNQEVDSSGAVTFDRHPDSYRHWRLRIAGEIAWLELDVDEHGGLVG